MDKLKQFVADNKAKIIWILTVLVLVTLFVFSVQRYGWGWTGFYGYPTETQTTTSGNITTVKSRTLDKTLWDWMQLFIIPAVLAGGAILLNRAQRQRELDIAEKERETERQIAKDREEERALQSYLEAMTRLLLEENLRSSNEAQSIARSRTLTILSGLDDGRRKASILRFLYEAKLIDIGQEPGETGINLDNADLRGANLWGADLEGANLERTNLEGANLGGANLGRTNLGGANLEKANLWWADLGGADLGRTNLEGANLRGVDLSRANLSGATYKADTKWPDGFNPEQAGAVPINE
jgi:hypothetical protein